MKDNAKRNLIHFLAVPGDKVEDAGCDIARLCAHGWRIDKIDRVACVLQGLRDNPDRHFVALLDLRGAHFDGADDLESMTPMLAAAQITWLAGVTPAQLDCAHVCRIIRDYCHDYVQLPCSDELLATLLGHMHGMAELSPDLASEHPDPGKHSMVGSSAVMRAMQQRLRKAAMTDAPVLIDGETGTGKELAAIAIHRYSSRHKQPFVAINCGAIPQGLIQSELFGYERGAFTGAMQRKRGRIEMAHRGTLFLDEIGDLPLDLQASLLRFLQEGTIERLGGHDVIEVDVRIIAATHVDMGEAIAARRFRADLYHRLCVIQLQQPPLRERGDDILEIADYALKRYGRESSGKAKSLSRCARQALRHYHWPGNVRELINCVRQAQVMADGRRITAPDLRLEAGQSAAGITLEDARSDAERAVIQQALQRNDHHLIATAAELGISRVTLYRMMNKHGLREQEPEHDGAFAMRVVT